MAAAGDATEVVLIDRDYKAKETPATREQGTPIFLGPRGVTKISRLQDVAYTPLRESSNPS
jgi:hypothetical protein